MPWRSLWREPKHGAGGGGGGSGQGRVIKDKAFSDVRKFEKGDSLWEGWPYDLKAALGLKARR